jgi:hypothetical protein
MKRITLSKKGVSKDVRLVGRGKGDITRILFCFVFWGISIYYILERLVMKTVDVRFLFSFFSVSGD